MDKFFLKIYDYFYTRRPLLFTIMGILAVILSFFASKISLEEDLQSFFPKGESEKTSYIFKNLKSKDKIFLLFSAKDSLYSDSLPDTLSLACEEYIKHLQSSVGDEYISRINANVEQDQIQQVSSFIYENLPIFLKEEDYARIDSLIQSDKLIEKMQTNYYNIVSPNGMVLKDIILKDPLGLASNALKNLQNLSKDINYTIYNGYIYSKDLSTLLIMIDPVYPSASTGKNGVLVDSIEAIGNRIELSYPNVKFAYCGGPSVGVYNARQIKSDTSITLTIALIIISVFISLAFKMKRAVVLILAPVLFGVLFALSIIYFIKGGLSAIAIGAGAAVLGIAVSYSIHIVSHRSHTKSNREIIADLAYPLTVGSFTTIGAFLGLLFTKSQLLRDFGLFSALTLIGTTLFALIFLPQMMRDNRESSKRNKILEFIEKINSYPFDRKPILLIAIALLTIFCLFKYNDVKFNSDMRSLSVEPTFIKKAENKLNTIFNSTDKTLIVSIDSSSTASIESYKEANKLFKELEHNNKVLSINSIDDILFTPQEQKNKIDRWNKYISTIDINKLNIKIEQAANAVGFAKGSFDNVTSIFTKDYKIFDITSKEVLDMPLYRDRIQFSDSMLIITANILLQKDSKEELYENIMDNTDAVIVDRSYFSNKMAQAVNDDFYLILYISSFLIFFTLLISFGRLELALMAFAPMALSWIIILGLMAIFKIEFNIVNIILSTFIFGLGDDFSIFIIDGLQNEYKTGKKSLNAHKVAMFFSIFTTVIGMGALSFAGHPALKSVSLISLLGMLGVVLIAYTLQPILFRIFISSPAKKGRPYTWLSLLNTLYSFLYFLFGCSILQGIIPILLILPIKKEKKKLAFHKSVSLLCKVFLNTVFTVKIKNINSSEQNFKEPSVIIANHQSFIDILLLLALNPKSVMVTNGWVWNSPFFGRIVRFADFYNTAEGYQQLVPSLKARVDEGYSIIVFPEGTRSIDCELKRFHKGAFYLAQELDLDIIPILLFGPGLISAKKQAFYINKGIIVTKILPRISQQDLSFGLSYKEKTKNISRYFSAEYDKLVREYSNFSNKYFYDTIIKSFVFKGPVLEWYMRIKIKMEKGYMVFDNAIKADAKICDIGCGYGPLIFMLGLYSKKRTFVGIDYDESKIQTANNSCLKSVNMNFIAANALELDLPQSDVFIMNDMLHYMPAHEQSRLIEKCIEKLNDNGLIIIRDGDNSKKQKHKLTRLTEKFSTEILGFNKIECELCFSSSKDIISIAKANNMAVKMQNNDNKTSNTIYFLHRFAE